MSLPLLDIAQFATTLPAKLSKDERRIQLFVADLPNVATRLAQSEPDKLDDFARESGALIVKWIGALGKISFGNFSDPFKGARNDSRKFAKKWAMSQPVIDELG